MIIAALVTAEILALVIIAMLIAFISIVIFEAIQWTSDKIAFALIDYLGYGARPE